MRGGGGGGGGGGSLAISLVLLVFVVVVKFIWQAILNCREAGDEAGTMYDI